MSLILSNALNVELAHQGVYLRQNKTSKYARDAFEYIEDTDQHEFGSADPLVWSDESDALKKILLPRKEGSKVSAKKNFEFVCSYLRTLRLRQRRITELDTRTVMLNNLIELDLTANKLEHLQNLPDSLLILRAAGNNICSINSCNMPSALTHAALAFNEIHSISFLPCSLVFLDLRCNALCDLNQTIQTLSVLNNLTELQLSDNPFTLLKRYRQRVLNTLTKLHTFDRIDVSSISCSLSDDQSSEELEKEEDNTKSADHKIGNIKTKSNLLSNSSEINEQKKIDFEQYVVLCVRIRNISGITIPQDCTQPQQSSKPPQSSDETLDQQQTTVYSYALAFRIPDPSSSHELIRSEFCVCPPNTSAMSLTLEHEAIFLPSTSWQRFLLLMGIELILLQRREETNQIILSDEQRQTIRLQMQKEADNALSNDQATDPQLSQEIEDSLIPTSKEQTIVAERVVGVCHIATCDLISHNIGKLEHLSHQQNSTVEFVAVAEDEDKSNACVIWRPITNNNDNSNNKNSLHCFAVAEVDMSINEFLSPVDTTSTK